MPDERDNDQPFRPRLVCRAFSGDTGARPLGPGEIFYESPDIVVTPPPGEIAPVAGRVNRVLVTVTNFGTAPSYGTFVDLYWCDPSVGVNLANATIVGSASTAVGPGASQTVGFDWTPVFANNGHECLVAQVYDPVADPLAAPFNPVDDRHVAQKNVNLLPLAPGVPARAHFHAANFSSRTQVSELELLPLFGTDFRQLAERFGDAGARETDGAQIVVERVSVKSARPRISLAEHPVASVFRESLNGIPSEFSRRLVSLALAAVPDRSPELENTEPPLTGPVSENQSSLRQVRRVTVPPNSVARFDIAFDVPAAGSAAFRIIERVGGRISGGVTYYLRPDPRNR
jgi:hypothetical protein